MKGSDSIFVVNGITAFLFSCTGPVAIILAVAGATGLGDQHVASWLFGGFAITGLFTIFFSYRHRQPIAFAWTIPGTVLLLSALDHLSYEQAVGSYMMTALLVLIVGITGLAKRIVDLIPKEVVMAMVAGVFLEFGLKLIQGFDQAALMSSVMVVSFILFTLSARMQKIMPPILAALLAGAIVVVSSDSIKDSGPIPGVLTIPQLFVPEFTISAMIELVVPMAVTVLMVQNAQGFAVLGNAGHRPPVNAMTTACGIGSFLIGILGSVPMCVTGPANAILSGSGQKQKQYIGGVTYGLLAIVFGVFSTFMTWLAFKLPESYIAVLGGLAGIRVLEGAFRAAFSDRHTMAALATLLITVSDITLFKIGAPFWGLVIGALLSAILKRKSN
ncbi:MAG: benzoate/H(+) symporter BenE family transporter [bacterium]